MRFLQSLFKISSAEKRSSGICVQRFYRNRRGNVLILWAFALIPLIALVGSAVDIGRAYIARNQMQSACDAAALAGRRAMTTSSVDDAVKAEAVKFFNFNFSQGLFGSGAFTPNVTAATSAKQTVVVSASTTLNRAGFAGGIGL